MWDVVVAHLETKGVADAVAEETRVEALRQIAAESRGMLELLDRVAVDWVLEIARGVAEDVEAVIDVIDVCLGHVAGIVLVPPLRIDLVALRAQAQERIEGAEAIEQSLRYGQVGDGILGAADRRIRPGRHAQSVMVIAQRVAEDAVELPIVVGIFPGAVVVSRLRRVEQGALAETARIGEQLTEVRVLARPLSSECHAEGCPSWSCARMRREEKSPFSA